jgi:hypothetical protein
MMRQAFATVHQKDSHTEGRKEAPSHTGTPEEVTIAVAGTHSAKDLLAAPRPERERWQQTFVIDARQGTIASGSCCCSCQVSSRSFVGYRTESFAVTAHAMADRHGQGTAEFVPARVS